MSDTSIVRLENVSKDYILGEQKVQALKDITLDIAFGAFLAIAGPSGSGKSTLLNLIGCIDTPTSGKVLINGQDISGRTPDDLSELRARTIGFVFQTFNLFPVLSAEENVEYPLLQFRELKTAERRTRVAEYLGIVGLSKFARHRPNQLSGGQRQRVAIARAIVGRPQIILADEPTGNLDSAMGNEIMDILINLNKNDGTTIVMVTHDENMAHKTHRLVRLFDGSQVQ